VLQIVLYPSRSKLTNVTFDVTIEQ
jgi:hypothetical protein